VTVAKGFLEGVPIYSGALTADILTASMEYKAKKPIDFAGLYENRKPIVVGDMKITPILTDVQKYNGYMLMIESGNKIILYTGDFKANTRTSFEEILAQLPWNIDILICNCFFVLQVYFYN